MFNIIFRKRTAIERSGVQSPATGLGQNICKSIIIFIRIASGKRNENQTETAIAMKNIQIN